VLRAGVAARARLTVALECFGDAVFLWLRRAERLGVTFLLREARLRVDRADFLAALAGRFVFTPPPCGPGEEPTCTRILAKGPQNCATLFY